MREVFEGSRAFNEGLTRTDCPYKGGQKRNDWLDGWNKRAGQDNESK